MQTSSIRRILGKWARSSRGNVAMISALSIIPILGVAGFAVDFQYAITNRTKVQLILDSAVIAGARTMQQGGSRGDVRAEIESYFDDHVDTSVSGVECGTVNVRFIEDFEEGEQAGLSQQDIRGDVTCTQSTTLTQIIGQDMISYDVSSGSVFGIGEVDVVFVLDVSGSMNQNNRLGNLEIAALDAIDTLLPEGNEDNGVRVSLVGYNHAVDAGDLFDDVTDSIVLGSDGTSENAGIRYEQTLGQVLIDQGSGLRFYDYERVSCNGNFNSSQCFDVAARRAYTSTCVYERLGDEALTDAPPGDDAFLGAGAPFWDYTDQEPGNRRRDSTGFQRKIAGQFEIEQGGANGQSGAFNPRYQQCRNFPPVPLTNDRDDLIDAIEDLNAGSGTAGHAGIAWGWYLLSPRWSEILPDDSEPLEYFAPDTAKAMIIMTDGDFNDQHPQTEDDSDTEDESDPFARAICDQIKDTTNIQNYTVAFEAPQAGIDVLDFCASGPEFSFIAENGEQLQQSFQTIANAISDLRITR